MKKKLRIVLYATLAGIMTLTSCRSEEKEDNPDVRDVAVGGYSGVSEFYVLNSDNELVVLTDEDGEPFMKNENVTLTVSKVDGVANAIHILCDGDTFTGEKIEATSNGFGFDMATTTFEGCEAIGYDVATVGSTLYNGAFFNEENEFKFGYKVSTEDLLEQLFPNVDTDENQAAEALVVAALLEDYNFVVVIFDVKK